MSIKRSDKKSTLRNVATDPVKEWVTLDKYCETTGDTHDAVRARRKKGIWPDGIITRIGPNGRIWVCLQLAYRWVENAAEVML